MNKLFFVSFVVAMFATSCSIETTKTVKVSDSIVVDSVKTSVVDTTVVATDSVK